MGQRGQPYLWDNKFRSRLRETRVGAKRLWGQGLVFTREGA